MFRSPLRRSAALLGLALVLVTFSGAVCADQDRIAANGTVRYQDLEGGFWGIVADDGAHYDPMNLAAEFQHDGLRVTFRAKPSKQGVSFHMWGTVIEITSIRRLEP